MFGSQAGLKQEDDEPSTRMSALGDRYQIVGL
jgi:hypothetical protein